MSATLIQEIEQAQLKTDLTEVNVGDTVDVHVRIIEGAKERIQVFNGVVIKIQGTGLTRTMTVRRIVANEGVERTFPIHSPRLAKVEVLRRGHTRRARLYYLRERVGKKRRLRDRRRGMGTVVTKADRKAQAKQAAEAATPAPEPVPASNSEAKTDAVEASE